MESAGWAVGICFGSAAAVVVMVATGIAARGRRYWPEPPRSPAAGTLCRYATSWRDAGRGVRAGGPLRREAG